MAWDGWKENPDKKVHIITGGTSFYEANFILEEKTGGYVSLGQILQTPDTLQTLQAITEPTCPNCESDCVTTGEENSLPTS